MNHSIEYLEGKLNIERFGSQYLAFSKVSASHISSVFPNFSIKYVFEGELDYTIESGSYHVSKNQVLYAASQPGEVAFDDHRFPHAIGLCVGFDEQLFLQALQIHATGCFDVEPSLPGKSFSEFPQFLEGVYLRGSKRICRLLDGICHSILGGGDIKNLVCTEWFLQLAEEIVREEYSNFGSFNRLPAAKTGTRKEILNRLIMAKEYMDDCFLKNPSISEVATIALLSQYHFFRSFKLAYGISPYQYLLNKRLDFAKLLIQNRAEDLCEVAARVGFSDQFSFSKSFKKKFHRSPSYFQNEM